MLKHKYEFTIWMGKNDDDMKSAQIHIEAVSIEKALANLMGYCKQEHPELPVRSINIDTLPSNW